MTPPVGVLHVTEDHTRRNTGITAQVNTQCAQLLPLLGERDSLAVCAVGGGSVNVPAGVRLCEPPLDPGAAGRLWRWSPGLVDAIVADARRHGTTLTHMHGFWMGPQYAGVKAAERLGLPSVLTSHGLVRDWALGQPGRLGALKKRIYLALVARRIYRSVTVMHAITPDDRDGLRRLFPGWRIELIPNSVDVAAIASALPAAVTPERGRLLFIGRLHPQKGVDLLVRAFAAAGLPADVRLDVVGPPEVAPYIRGIQDDAARLGVADRVSFHAPAWGPEKFEMMQRAWAVMVPSRHEVTGLVNLEAAACATPTLTTWETGLLDWEDGGGLLARPAVDDLAQALRRIAAWSDEERRDRGRASYDLVTQRYSTAVTAPRWMDLYRELCA